MQKKYGVAFQLEFLPAYSPNLNLIERLWKFLKKHALSDWHISFEAMQQAVANVLDHLDQYAGPPSIGSWSQPVLQGQAGNVLKVPSVVGHQDKVVCQGDSRDHQIRGVDRDPLPQ